MTFDSASISADTVRHLHHGMTATRQPPRLRVMSAFARPVDLVNLVDPVEIATLTTIYPPLTKQPLISCRARQKRAWGREESCPHRGIIHPGSDSHNNEYACIFPARKPVRARTDSSLATAHPHGEPPRGFLRCTTLFIHGSPEPNSVVPGKIHSPLGILRGRITVGARPRLSCFSPRRRAFSTVVRRIPRHPKHDAARPRRLSTIGTPTATDAEGLNFSYFWRYFCEKESFCLIQCASFTAHCRHACCARCPEDRRSTSVYRY